MKRTALSLAFVLGSTFLLGCGSVRGAQDGAPPKDRDDEAHAFELEQARGALKLAELERESELTSAEAELAFAREDLAAAERSLAAFRQLARPHADGESELALRQAKNRLLDAEAELAELEAMYADDDFAEKTKELVLSRGRRSLEVARRAVELAEVERRHLVEEELTEKERQLTRALEEARIGVVQAERSLARAKLQSDLALAKARHEVAEKEREAEGGDGK